MSSTEATLDITSETCPITFVRAKLALEILRPGQLLRIRLNDGEPLINVPRSLLDHGHEILATRVVAKSVSEILVRRGPD